MRATIIEAIGELAHEMIFRSPNAMVGKIIHTFTNAIYIKTDDDNLICITSYRIMAPMNVIIPKEFDFAILNHHNDNNREEVYCEKDGFRIRDIYFDSSKSAVYHRRATDSFRISWQLAGNALAAARMLSKVNRKDSILDANSPFHNRLLSVASKMAYAAGSKSFDEIQDIIPHTIGLGSGFTPSGDDFLAAFLFTLNQILAQSQGEPAHIFRIEGSSNWASRKFIEYAQKGFVIEPLESYVNALLKGAKQQEVARRLDTLVGVGHSSGVDASVGAVMAMSYDMGKQFCDKLRQSIFCL
jgi:uncharacterized protein DUF2877